MDGGPLSKAEHDYHQGEIEHGLICKNLTHAVSTRVIARQRRNSGGEGGGGG